MKLVWWRVWCCVWSEGWFHLKFALVILLSGLHGMLSRFGLGEITGADIPGEAGGLLPSTRREDEMLGETRDQIVQRAAEAGRGLRALDHVDPFDRLRNDEIQIGIALPVAVSTQIDRHVVDEKSDIRAMIGIESPQEVLIPLAGPARMFDGNEPGNQPEHLGRTALRLQENFLVRDKLLG